VRDRSGQPSTASRQMQCTVCLRTVGVARNWAKVQDGLPDEYRVSRHFRASTRQFCSGSGVLVGPEDLVRGGILVQARGAVCDG